MNPGNNMGIDIGRVIIEGDTDQGASMFSPNFLKAPAVKGAFDTIARIAERRGPQSVFLVSKCGETIAERSRAWLHHNDFFTRTGIAPTQVHFCRKRQDKRIICDQLAIQCFIDDRFTVLQHLVHLPRLFLFNPDSVELAQYQSVAQVQEHIHCVRSWNEVAKALGI